MDVSKPADIVMVFILDTSASMNQIMSHNLSAFEASKTAIKMILKFNSELFLNQTVQAALFTYNKEPFAFQSKQSTDPGFTLFFEKLSNLKAYDFFNGERAVQEAYEYLHLFRMGFNSDSLGEGRKPFNGKRNFICWFTDGESMVTPDGVSSNFNTLPLRSPGHQFFQADSRWDQKLFIYYLSPKENPVPSFIKRFATLRGGIIFHHCNFHELKLQLDAQMHTKGKIKGPDSFNDFGLVANFQEELSKDKYSHPLMVKLSYCTPNRPITFPFPESYYYKSDVNSVPPRETIPRIYYEKGDKFSTIQKDYPSDEYIVSPCPLTQDLLSQHKPPCWPVNIPDSFHSAGKGFPFGYLTCNKATGEVKLVVLGYNYKTINWLIEQYYSTYHGQLTSAYVSDVVKYFDNTPFYYHKTVMNILISYGITSMDYSMCNHENSLIMKTIQSAIKEAQEEYQKLGYLSYLTRQHESGKSLLSLDVFQVPRADLLSSLHQMKHIFFQCGVKEDLDSVKEVLPANKRIIPIDKMGDYSSKQRCSLKNPLDSEEDILYKEKVQFGNPFANRDEILAGKVASTPIDQAGQPTSSRGKLDGNKQPRPRSVSPGQFNPKRLPKLRAISALSDTEDDSDSEYDSSVPSSPRKIPTRVRMTSSAGASEASVVKQPIGPANRQPNLTSINPPVQSNLGLPKPPPLSIQPSSSAKLSPQKSPVRPPPPPPIRQAKSGNLNSPGMVLSQPINYPRQPVRGTKVSHLSPQVALPHRPAVPTTTSQPAGSLLQQSTPPIRPNPPSAGSTSGTNSSEKPPTFAQIKSQLVQSIERDDEATILRNLEQVASDQRYPAMRIASLFKTMVTNSKVARKKSVTDFLESSSNKLKSGLR